MMSFYLDEEGQLEMIDTTNCADMASGPTCVRAIAPLNRYRSFARERKLAVDVELAEAQKFVDELIEYEERGQFFRNALVERRKSGELKIVGELDCGARLTIDYHTYKDRPEELRFMMRSK